MGGCCVGNCCVMNNAVGDFFRGIFGGDRGGCGYHPGPSENELHAKKIADELAEMKENIRKSSEDKEKKIINYINKSMTEFIGELDKVNRQSFGGKNLNINIKGIREKNEMLTKQVVGCIGNVMDERLVLTDKELSVILEERDDEKRGKNFDNFCKRVQKESLRGLSKKIRETVSAQENMIRKEIQDRLTEVDQSMRAATKAYSEILSVKEQNEGKMEETQMKYIYEYELAEILLDQLEG